MERRVYPLPVSAEIPAEAIRYSDVRSRVEIASEVTPVINFRESNLRILYIDLSMSSKSVGRAVGLSRDNASRLMQRRGIVMRSSYDPVYGERRLEGISSFYSDPVKVAEKNSKVHTPEARIKQADSLRKRHQTDPDFSSEQAIRIRKAREAFSQNAAERRSQRVASLGEHDRLQAERELQFAQSLRGIPAYRMLSPRQKQVIELRYRIDGGLSLSFEQIGEALGGLSRQAVQQYEKNALIRLGVFKNSGSSQETGVKK